jgi:NAD(P)-dependent dehydrogenase (short-subunit alcohol dehydrogenase family)
MTSPHWNEAQAEALRRFQFHFPEKPLAGKTVVVAGGTGGLGAATVALLAREGARLIVGYRSNQARAAELHAAIEKNSGASLTLIEGDVADRSVRGRYLQAVETEKAPLAGAAIFPGDPARVALPEIDRDSMLASFETNCVGPLLLARDLGELMEKSSAGGSIVLLSTMQALAAFPSSLNYAVPKSALLHAARILAQHWSRVRVNVVAPGATIAGMAATSIQSGKYDRHISSGVVSRFGRPEDVARAVRFFLEPDNYITGQTLLVDGGLTLRRDRG